MQPFSMLVGLSLAMGVGLMTHTVLSTIFETGRRLQRPGRRGRLYALGLDHGPANEEKKTEEVLLGMRVFPWSSAYALAALIGLALLAILGPQFPAIKIGFLALPGLVWLAKRYWIQQHRRFMLGQIRQFLVDVRLHMSLQGSLLLGLESLAKTSLETYPVYLRLQRRLKGSSARSGIDLLGQLAEDLKSPQLLRAVQRVQAAQLGGGLIDVDQAIASVIEELNEEIGYQTEEQMQRLPLRITLLSMPFLLGPIVILLFYPLVDRILKTLSGVSIGGGF